MKCKPFQRGDIAILQNLPLFFRHLNGEECEVLSGLQEFRVVDIFGTISDIPCYKILHRNREIGVLPEHLRHRKEPETTVSEHELDTIGV